MNKLEFLTRLRGELERGGMPSDDINDALSYYEEVFLDAGFGKEEETAASMGSPENVAADILRESGIVREQRTETASAAAVTAPHKKTSGAAIVLGIILGILTFPIWLPVLCVVVSLLFALIVVILSVVFAVGVSSIGFIIAGIAALFEFPAVGIMFIGGGLILAGISILICKPFFSVIIPGIARAIKSFCGWIIGLFRKEGK